MLLGSGMNPLSLLRVASLALAVAVAGCSSSTTSSADPPPPAGGTHPVSVAIAFHADANGKVALSDFQGPSSIAAADIQNKPVYAAVWAAGDQPGNGQPLATAGGVLGRDLTTEIALPSPLPDATYELSLVVSLSGRPANAAPDPIDLVGFTDPRTAPLAAGDPPFTGQTIRFHVAGDTVVPADGTNFIVYGAATGGAK